MKNNQALRMFVVHLLNILACTSVMIGWTACVGCGSGSQSNNSTFSNREDLPPVDTDDGTLVNDELSGAVSQPIPQPSQPSQHEDADISVDEAKQFAADWIQTMASGNAQALRQVFDWDNMVNRALAELDLPSDKFEDVKSGLLSSLIGQMASQLARQIGAGDSYDLVRIVRRNGKPHVLIRLFSSEQGLNYHDIQLKRSGSRLIGDRFFIAVTGEELADTIKATITPALQADQSVFAQLSGTQKKEAEALKKLGSLSTAIQSGNPRSAIEIYHSLPKDIQDRKMALLTLIQASLLSGDQSTYLAAIKRYVQNFPDDPSSGFVAIDIAVTQGDIEQLRRSYHSIKNWTGGDPFLDLMMGSVICQMGQVAEGVEMTRHIDPVPLQLASAHDYKLTIALAAKDHATVLENLRAMRDQYGFEFSHLTDAEGFEEFVESEQFQEWLADAT